MPIASNALWRAGEVDKVRQYCIQDVKITRGVLDYALEKGGIKYKELGKSYEVKLNTKNWLTPASEAMTFGLGF
jgi:hypothetical protein